MDNVLQKLMGMVKEKRVGRGLDAIGMIEGGEHLASYKDINDVHKIFVDSLDESHPKAVEMLLAAEKMKGMLEEFRVDRDALSETHAALGAVLGCAKMLADATNEADGNEAQMQEAVQKHFFNMLTLLSALSSAHMKYAKMVIDTGPYSAREE